MSFIFIGCTQKKLDPIVFKKSVKSNISYKKDIQPILNNRCVVCHSCYNSPCQLKLSSYDGLSRGASKIGIYDNRLKAQDPTRLFIDATNTKQWREKGFFSISKSQINENESLAMHMLQQKKKVPMSKGTYESESNTLTCSKDENELAKYFEKKPHSGMPFGFPQLQDNEHKLLMTWLYNGAKNDNLNENSLNSDINKWENFFNHNSIKHKVTARYIYEHLFIGHIYFENNPNEFYELVRSSTPNGQPIKVIATRLPYDNPNKKVYYRFRKITSTIVDKTHMVYKLNDAKLKRYNELFIKPKWNEKPYLPSYDIKTSSNPFKIFKQIPAKSRYEFLLDDVYFVISNFIKGPVCKGQIALNVIHDHFWIMFMDPDYDLSIKNKNYLNNSINNLSLPNEKGSNTRLVNKFFGKDFNNESIVYYENRANEYKKSYPKGLTLNHIWNDKYSDSSVMTIYRHFDSASLHKGALGNIPRTLWVVDYPLLERIYYSLVAGFDIFGNISHQVMVRQYMNRLRIEGESNFLDFLPKKVRKKTFEEWYVGWLSQYVTTYHYTPINTAIKFKSENYKEEFVLKVLDKTDTKLDKINYIPKGSSYRGFVKHIKTKSDINTAFKIISQSNNSNFLKEFNSTDNNLGFVRIKMENNKDLIYSMVANRWHDNVTFMFNESNRLNPEYDKIDFIEGFIGSYPNYFFVVEQKDLNDFFDLLGNYQDTKKYKNKLHKYGVNRSDKDFWKVYDWFQKKFYESDRLNSGLFDLNRYYKEAL